MQSKQKGHVYARISCAFKNELIECKKSKESTLIRNNEGIERRETEKKLHTQTDRRIDRYVGIRRQTDIWIYGWMYERMEGWMDGRTDGWTDEPTEERMNGAMDEQKERRYMDGCMKG